MEIPNELFYTKKHEWTRVEGDIATIGITDYAQEQLGDIVYVEMPKVGAEVEQTKEFGVVESVKTVSNLYAPLTGTVTEINKKLNDAPETVNNDPYVDGWIIKIKMADKNEVDDLLSSTEYEETIEKE